MGCWIGWIEWLAQMLAPPPPSFAGLAGSSGDPAMRTLVPGFRYAAGDFLAGFRRAPLVRRWRSRRDDKSGKYYYWQVFLDLDDECDRVVWRVDRSPCMGRGVTTWVCPDGVGFSLESESGIFKDSRGSPPSAGRPCICNGGTCMPCKTRNLLQLQPWKCMRCRLANQMHLARTHSEPWFRDMEELHPLRPLAQLALTRCHHWYVWAPDAEEPTEPSTVTSTTLVLSTTSADTIRDEDDSCESF